MRNFLLSILSIASFTAFSQWTVTPIFSTGEDCFSAFGLALASDATSNALGASSNDGAAWTSSNTGVPASGLSFGAINSGTLYAYRNRSIYRSTTGNNWTSMTTTAIGATEVIKGMAVLSGTAFVCTNPISGNGIKIYQLNGATWTFKANVPVATASLSTCMENMNGELWVGSTATLNIKSTNAGTTWAAANGTLTSAAWWDQYTLCMAANTSTLFFGNYGGRVFKSTNAGATWNSVYNISTGSTISISDIYVLSASRILLACDSGFVYSNDGGNTFTKDNLGLSAANKYFKKITATANYIIASTGSGAIVRRPITQIFSTGISENELTTIESKVYPNPASDMTTIEAGDLMFNDNCKVILTDVLGREVDVVEMKEGKANVSLSNFSTGLYTYSIYNNKTLVSKGKLVVN